LEKGYGLLVFLLGLLVFYRELLTVSEITLLLIKVTEGIIVYYIILSKKDINE